MKLYCLSAHPNKPCIILQFKEVTIMLDCGLWAASVTNFLPMPLVPSQRLNSLNSWVPRDCSDPQLDGELKECGGRIFVDSSPEFGVPANNVIDYSQIDVILISNYSSMLALPFITENTGFQGVVYATEPTLQIGRLFLEELVQTVERSPKAASAKHWKAMQHLLLPPLKDAPFVKSWRHLFDAKNVAASLSKVQMVGYSEVLDVFGALTVTPVSSGYCIGSSNWIISSQFEKVVYVSASSVINPHSTKIDLTPLKNADLMILSDLTQTPLNDPDSSMNGFINAVAETLGRNGNVLLPCYPSGVVYDLFECLSDQLAQRGMANANLFFISPVADSSLAYSNILAEWLSGEKQNKVYTPEEPFPHAQLVQHNRLKHFKNLWASGFNEQYRQPCVVFCGHPSLRFGDSVHFMEMWGSSPLNTVVFTEPDFSHVDALAPFQPLAMNVKYWPIDMSLSAQRASKLIRDARPKNVAVAAVHLEPHVAAPHRTDFVIEADCPILPLRRGEVVTVPVTRQKEQLKICPSLAKMIRPTSVRPGVNLATVTSSLLVRDNKFTVNVVEDVTQKPIVIEKPLASGSKRRRGAPTAVQTVELMPPSIKHRKPSTYTWGTLDIDDLLARMSSEGILVAKPEPDSNGNCVIHLPKEDTLIQVEPNSTHIFCPDEALRSKLRTILMRCLNKF
ncbi:integrator complex subunit 9 isoform X2 [Cloeon dipterum]|uniref:integrator complex subunit 9 isoform X2 n=1 Tax=Cloeon dipterum TaxID=197152 RepID=UPI00321FE225